MTGARSESSLVALALRIETATEGSRELDADIWRAAEPEKAAAAVNCLLDEANRRELQRHLAPAFSTSVDAALPGDDDGFWIITGRRRFLNIPSPARNHWCAEFMPYTGSATGPFIGWGATEALARRAASLRARPTGET